jgi:hypothetical protein
MPGEAKHPVDNRYSFPMTPVTPVSSTVRFLRCWCFLWPFLLAGLFARETEIRHLSGTGPENAVPWEFLCTGGRNSGTWTTIPVPSCWEQQGFGTYNYGVHHRPGRDKPNPPPLADEEGHYRHTFRVPAEWRDRAVRIVFDGVMTDAEVKINGKLAGPVHQGSFYRFHHEITALLNFDGDNRLEVVVRKKSANESVNRAERIGDYWIFGGIFRPVWLEARPREHIEWTGIDARADGTFTADVHLGAPAPAAGRVTGVMVDRYDRELSPPLAADVPVGATKVTLTGRFEHPDLWTAETPNLHRMKFTYAVAGGADSGAGNAHTVTERFGFRTFEVRPNDGLYLNGTKIILKGVNRHCFNPDTGRTISREQSYADARLIKEMNMNAVRMSHYQPDKHFLEACDELGLYVLNELAGWQGFYDTPTGTRLIGQLVRRDVNHPSVLFWCNGNEGGWNTAVDGEYAKWDIQQRPVLHPWAKFSEVDTDHYEPWDSHVKKSAGPMIYMPTEFLHGLYDGGIGAGLRDYWDVMMKHPTVAGGFFWVFADEGIARADQGGRIDNAGNLAPDGIVGPRGEREGSFYTVKEIWSPVQMTRVDENVEVLDHGNRELMTLSLKNDFAFTNLKDCTFLWRHVRLPEAGDQREPQILTQGALKGPDVPPGGSGLLTIAHPQDGFGKFHRLYVTALDPEGRELTTFSDQPGVPVNALHSPFKPRALLAKLWNVPEESLPPDPVRETPTLEEASDAIVVQARAARFTFSKTTGRLTSAVVNGRDWSFLTGPTLLALKRQDRTFAPVGLETTLVSLTHSTTSYDGRANIVAKYENPTMTLYWGVTFEGKVSLDYNFTVEGEFDVLGLRFNLPDEVIKSKRWLGEGPYRVWRNRMEGGQFAVHEVDFNDATPGEAYAYPEFKGYFHDWRWLTLETTAGRLIAQPSPSNYRAPFFALGKPRDGVDGLLDLPDAGLSFLEIIPAMRNKFHTTDQLGPQSATPTAKGSYSGAVVFRFDSR